MLAVQTVAQGNRLIKDIDQLLQTLYALFNRKAKRVALWELFAARHGVKAFKFPMFVKTRWFSRQACIQRIISNFPVLVQYLQGVTTLGSSMYWDSAKPVLELLKRADVVVMLRCLADILEPLKRAQKLFETSGFSLHELQGELNVLQALLAALQDSAHSLKTCDGSNMRRLLEISNGLESSHGNIVLKWKEQESRRIPCGTCFGRQSFGMGMRGPVCHPWAAARGNSVA
jgi:hypothetical protein